MLRKRPEVLHILADKLGCPVMVVEDGEYAMFESVVVLADADIDREKEVDQGEQKEVNEGFEEVADRFAALGSGDGGLR